MSDYLCPVCGARGFASEPGDSAVSYKCGRRIWKSSREVDRPCRNAESTIATLRAELAKHDDTAKLLADYAEQHGQSWRDADERKGLHARPSSTSGDVILKLVELGEMELIHNDNAWGICAVWTEET